ncbi:RSP_2648 family PIN domain-containing protein [Litoreibacter janthinus]|uniref:PIN domain-containing protein n=1 Tax=Litoreibacter janthinus TaxID=670154 RepID=A0A1I6GPF1_9RHOB|nr:PIN domain-containing protein [Litoreibacter janthinus]SFR44115.1 PIN domain-containing protein [Litoreibacter janthinus]
MRALLDACVIYPTVLREVLVGCAGLGLYEPLWSERILEEWARATVKLGADAEVQARGEVAVLKAQYPNASVRPRDGDMIRLHLPDENDIHVLAAAIAGSADVIVTLNAKDFPRQTLAFEGLKRQSPDEFLMELWLDTPAAVEQVVRNVHKVACEMSGEELALRGLMKRARLPRLGKAVG